MKSKKIFLLFSLVFFVGLLVFIGAKAQPAQADSTRQDVPCGVILEDAAQLAGIDSMEAEWISDGTDPWGCEVRYCSECNGIRSEGMEILLKIDKVADFQPFQCFRGHNPRREFEMSFNHFSRLSGEGGLCVSEFSAG